MVGGLMTRMVARQGRKLAKVVATTTVGMAALFYFFTSRKFAIVEREIRMVRISHHSHTYYETVLVTLINVRLALQCYTPSPCQLQFFIVAPLKHCQF